VESATHEGVQALPPHVRPVRHAGPQPPQFATSCFRSTQLPPHGVRPVSQPAMHVWPEHVLSGSPHSAVMQHSKHPCPAQQCWPQVSCPHTPLVHVSAVHASPSLHWLPSQHCLHSEPQSLGVSAEHRQVPAEHIAPGLQAIVHAPQCRSSLVSGASQPFALCPSQFPQPASHTAADDSQC